MFGNSAWNTGYNGGSQWGNNFTALDHHNWALGASAKAAEEAAKKAAADAAAQTKKSW